MRPRRGLPVLAAMLALGGPAAGAETIAGRMQLLVPDEARENLRIMALEGEYLVETGRCALPAPVTGPITSISPGEVSVGVSPGRQVVVLTECLARGRPGG